MEFDSINYPITPDTNQDIQTKSLRNNVTISDSNLNCNFLYGGWPINW